MQCNVNQNYTCMVKEVVVSFIQLPPLFWGLVTMAPGVAFQLLLGEPGAFPYQSRCISPPASSESAPQSAASWSCLENFQREVCRRHPDQMPEPSQLAPFDAEEQHLCITAETVPQCTEGAGHLFLAGNRGLGILSKLFLPRLHQDPVCDYHKRDMVQGKTLASSTPPGM